MARRQPPAKPTVAPANAQAGQGQPRPPRPQDVNVRPKGIKVRALQTCYYDDKRRRVGDVFTISSERFPKGHAREGQVKEFSSRYMEEVDPATPEKITTGAEVLKQEHDGIRASKLVERHPEAHRPNDAGVEGDDDE